MTVATQKGSILMNRAEQKAYDALGQVQTYYRTHEVGQNQLWQDKDGVQVHHHNGEAAACIWGALIATDGATKFDYVKRRIPNSLIAEALRARNGLDMIQVNDSRVKGDKTKMRRWLTTARHRLKADKVG